MTSMNVKKPKVAFDEVEILEFNYILGDNPGVSSGAPIALGDELKSSVTLEVDYYEVARGKRRSRKKLSIPVHERAQILLNEGYSLETIAAATMEADNISRERIQSANMQSWDKVNEVSERFSKLFTKALRSKRAEPKKSTLAAHSA
ncbi:hypothetical protein IV203_018397 [Nitzschia inconspicua]|uniref:Uncharacterized protein n=1 Tax=Nitzschia inconspicua TaxID=303405 RepID=A0A9K3KG82_9STRA|nr:hypothetical protein IV203_021063 [Nitzschia inconspicua]KAG7372254.1 hypothetical protein IV203_018397 [Nitzschia inconspicua]